MSRMPAIVATSALLVLTCSLDIGGVLAQEPDGRPFWRPVVMGTFGMVAAEHPLETIAGMEILRTGGNAFDAAAGVMFGGVSPAKSDYVLGW